MVQTTKHPTHVDSSDLVHTGPGTLAGRYMRTFWHPVYDAEELPAGRAKPVRIMGEDFTLYRGEGGTPHAIAFRCAHRGTQLSTGWVEGDNLRCFYHGWVYDGGGQCVEQPAEPEAFCQRIKIRSYPVDEYHGLLFVYMGEGNPPPFPRYEGAERATLSQAEIRMLPYNFWNTLDNHMDYAHSPFVHLRGGGSLRKREYTRNGQDLNDLPSVEFEETPWGYTGRSTFPSGAVMVQHILMPNVYLHKSHPGAPRATDPEQGWHDTIRWTVPVDDERHLDVSLFLGEASEEEAQRYRERRKAALTSFDSVSQDELVNATLEGRMTIEELGTYRVAKSKLQDNVARLGQGVIANAAQFHLGHSDRSLVLYRRLWMRDLQALAEGRPLTQWARPEGLLASWG